MPEIDPSKYGKRTRKDGLPGYELVTPTTNSYVEEDGSDVRTSRVRIFDGLGNLEKVMWVSPMGQPFADMPEFEDDAEYLMAVSGLVLDQIIKL